jgi:Bacterial Ig-like domain (group 2)/Divergent InlB B-repeat domain
MSQKWSALAGLLAIIGVSGLLLSLSSCARDQELTTITIQPATETFGATNIPVDLLVGANVQLRAIGSYIHPPLSKDLTNQVVWNSNTPDMVTVNSTGLITVTGNACGDTLISATVTTSKSSGNIVTGYMKATVVCFTGTGGGGTAGPTLTVSIGGGTGLVQSVPTGITCPGTCFFSFSSGTQVTLTATPIAPSTTTNWTSGCDTVTGNVCTVTMNGNRPVTLNFN